MFLIIPTDVILADVIQADVTKTQSDYNILPILNYGCHLETMRFTTILFPPIFPPLLISTNHIPSPLFPSPLVSSLSLSAFYLISSPIQFNLYLFSSSVINLEVFKMFFRKSKPKSS